MTVRYRQRDPLVPPQDVDEFVSRNLVPRWVKYGSVVTGAALVLARLGGIAYADDGGHGGSGHGGGHGDGDHGGGHAAMTHAPAAPAAAHSSGHGGGSAKAVQPASATSVKGS